MKKTSDYQSPRLEILEMETEMVIAVSDLLGLPGTPFSDDLINNYEESF